MCQSYNKNSVLFIYAEEIYTGIKPLGLYNNMDLQSVLKEPKNVTQRNVLTLILFPNPAQKGFVDGGNRALMSRIQLILNCSGFRSITSLLYKDDTQHIHLSTIQVTSINITATYR